jgi:hypothetical protein
VGNILDVVLIIKSDENLSLVRPPSLTKIIFPINYLGGVPHFGYPGQPGKADMMRARASHRSGEGAIAWAMVDLVPV